jgi:inner membrane protein
MDNLTHTLFGAVLAEARLKRRTPLAAPALLIGANLPDIDIVAAFVGHSLSFRRGWTHGVLAIVVLPILLTLGLLAWNRWMRTGRRYEEAVVRPGQLLLVATLGVLSHPFLDWLNSYGLRWLMPFDHTWFYGDALFIIDPSLLLMLIVGMLLARRRSSPGIGQATVALALTYIAVMLGTAAFGRAFVVEHARDLGLRPRAIMVGPVPVDPMRRQVIIREGDGYRTGTLSWVGGLELSLDDGTVPIGADHPAAVAAARIPQVRRMLSWSRFPFFVVADDGAEWVVSVDDLRYSDRSVGSFARVDVRVPREGVDGTGYPP